MEEEGRKRWQGTLGKRGRRRALTSPNETLQSQYSPSSSIFHCCTPHSSQNPTHFQKIPYLQHQYIPSLPNSSYFPVCIPHPNSHSQISHAPSSPLPTTKTSTRTSSPKHLCPSCLASRFCTCRHATQKRKGTTDFVRRSNKNLKKRRVSDLGKGNKQKSSTSVRAFLPVVRTQQPVPSFPRCCNPLCYCISSQPTSTTCLHKCPQRYFQSDLSPQPNHSDLRGVTSSERSCDSHLPSNPHPQSHTHKMGLSKKHTCRCASVCSYCVENCQSSGRRFSSFPRAVSVDRRRRSHYQLGHNPQGPPCQPLYDQQVDRNKRPFNEVYIREPQKEEELPKTISNNNTRSCSLVEASKPITQPSPTHADNFPTSPYPRNNNPPPFRHV
eukprot:Rhum_TRINITY_DN15265_c2_g3::Rhum_TRINITY_DN15265_c2_g3_i3::g.146580::m.146580